MKPTAVKLMGARRLDSETDGSETDGSETDGSETDGKGRDGRGMDGTVAPDTIPCTVVVAIATTLPTVLDADDVTGFVANAVAADDTDFTIDCVEVPVSANP